MAYSDKIKSKALNEYKSGKSSNKVSDIIGCSKTTILNWIKNSNQNIRSISEAKRKEINDYSFSSCYSEESQYWIGFLFADGCLQKNRNRISISLSINDKNHIKKLKKFLCSKHTIKDCSNTTGRRSILQFTSERIYEDLQKYGINPNKSDSRVECKVSSNLILNRHLWRGVVDGDGYVGVSSNKLFAFNLSGRESLLTQFKYYLSTIGLGYGVEVRHSKRNSYCFATKGIVARNICNELYLNSNIYLDRKMKIVKENIIDEL